MKHRWQPPGRGLGTTLVAPRPAHATPDTLQRRFLDTPGEIITTSAGITRLLTLLRHASLPADTTVSWWGGRRFRFEFA